MKDAEFYVLKSICFIFLPILIIILSYGCTDNQSVTGKSPLEHSLDSAERMFLSPKSEKIVKRIFNQVLSERNVKIKIRGLRIFSTVMLTADWPTPNEIDSAASYVKQAEQLALSIGDSTEWALCTIQLFRYRDMQRVWGFESSKVEPMRDLHLALKILEERNQTDWLSYGYRVLARAIIINQGEGIDVLNYELTALRYNDSAKYPIVRARILLDMAIDYDGYFKANKSAENFYLRALGILSHTDDTLDYVKTLYNIANCVSHDTVRSISYLKQAIKLSGNGLTPVSKAEVCFQLADKFQSMGKYDSALAYHDWGIRLISSDFNDNIAYQHAVMARSYIHIGQREKAVYWMALYDQLDEQKNQDQYELMYQLRQLADAYDALGYFKQLIKIQSRIFSLGDSIYSSENLSRLGRIENRYTLELKNKEVKILQMSNELQIIAAAKQVWVRILLISVVVLTTFGLLLVNVLRAKQIRLNKSLQVQNSTIEEQKSKIEKSLRDLTQTQARILNSEKMLMLGQLTTGVAHELNNPLNFISGGISVFEEAAEEIGLPRKEFQILHDIRVGIDQAMHIVGSLRVFFDPESAPGFFAHANIAECMTASLLVLQSKIRHHKIRIESNVPAFVVVGHSSQLCQVFINLLDNAIHAVKGLPEERKIIEILARRDSSRVLIDFKDHGYGIPETVRAKLFQPFYTSNPVGHRKGLGLFTSETILRKLNGSISFVSHAQEGTMFIVQLNVPE